METWLKIDEVHDPNVIEYLCLHFDLSPLQIEGIAKVDQQPKSKEHNSKLVIYLNMLRFNDKQEKVSADQLTLILGESVFIS